MPENTENNLENNKSSTSEEDFSVTFASKENVDGDTVGIEYDFSNYGKYKGLVKNSLVITLNYTNFGNIEKVEEPS